MDPSFAWTPVNGFWEGYDAQDNDGGCVGFFNGAYSTYYRGDRLTTPKISLKDYADPKLTFYALLARESESVNYNNPALLRVCVSPDDDEFVYLTEDEDMSFDGSDKEWKKFIVDLSPFVGSSNIRIGFDGYTNAYQEILLVDNIKIDGEYMSIENVESGDSGQLVAASDGAIEVAGCEGLRVMVADVAGKVWHDSVAASRIKVKVPSGLYIVSIFKNGIRSIKVMVK